jgi:hypothetical protein
MAKTLLILVFTVLTVFIRPLKAEPIVGLTVKERAGVARILEPVLTGVSLPESLYTDTSQFALKDAAGNVIPCEFRTAAKWWRDKQSIRWLHVDFQTSIDSGGEKAFVLHREPASHAVQDSKLRISDLGTKYQVDTGPLRFTVKKQGFNLFDEVWVDESGSQNFDAAHQIINSHAKGFSHLAFYDWYHAVNDTNVQASVERQGPMSAVIKIEGRLKDSTGSPSFYFLTRIYAYNNSKIVKVVFTTENRTSTVGAFIGLHALNMALPLNLSTVNFTLGAKNGPKTGTLQAGEDAYLLVNGISDYRYGGVLGDSGSTRLDKSVDMGWAAFSDGQKGMGLSMRWFWQNYPSSIECSGNGTVCLGLFSDRYQANATVTAYPPRHPNYYRFVSGMSKTHELRFVFFNGDSNDEVRSRLVGAESRLYAVTPAAWYCRGTRALGNMLEYNNPSLYYAAQWNQVNTYETALRNGALKCLGNTNVAIGGKDAYDYLGWGDNPHQFYGAGNLMWNGNYYGLPHLFYQHFIRTLDYRFLDYANAHTSHIQDLHIVHFEPGDTKDGANRYCPPTNHVGADAVTANVQDHTSHHKTQSLFEKYYLTGEDRALDVAFKGLKWIKYLGAGMAGAITTYARRPAHVLFTLTYGYKHTLASSEYTVMLDNYNGIKQALNSVPTPGQNWMVGLLTEALVDVYEITGDDDVAQTVKVFHDRVSNLNANAGFSLGFASRYFNNPADLSRAYSSMSSFGSGVSFTHQEKEYALDGHSLARAFYYFAIPDSAENRNVDRGIGITNAPSMEISNAVFEICPNPFYASIKITVRKRARASAFGISVYDITGKRIKTINPSFCSPGTLTWKAAGCPPGVYFVELTLGNKTYCKKAILLR